MNYPAQQYPPYPQPPVQQFPQQPMAPAPQYPTYPQQGYPAPAPQPYPQAPQQPVTPAVNGSLDDFYNQPSTGGGPSISWKDKPVGTTYAGIVARDVTNADVQQQINFQTKQPEFYRDGRPKFVMKVPLRVQPTQEFPDGEAAFYVRGQARDELVRAMGEAGESGAPKAGALIQVTLVQRKPSGQGMNPSNVVQIQYTPPQGAGAPSPAPAPQQQVQPQVQQPQGQVVNLEQAVAQAPAPQVQPPAPAYPAPQTAPVMSTASGQPVVHQQQVPAPQPVQQPAAPSDLSPEQQALLARLTGGQG